MKTLELISENARFRAELDAFNAAKTDDQVPCLTRDNAKEEELTHILAKLRDDAAHNKFLLAQNQLMVVEQNLLKEQLHSSEMSKAHLQAEIQALRGMVEEQAA